MSSERRKIGNVVVERIRIIGTRRDVYSAWEPETGAEYKHATVTHFDEPGAAQGRFGRIGTTYPPYLPTEIAKPCDLRVRTLAIEAWERADSLRAVSYVLAAFPELANRAYSVDGGRVTVEGEHL